MKNLEKPILMFVLLMLIIFGIHSITLEKRVGNLCIRDNIDTVYIRTNIIDTIFIYSEELINNNSAKDRISKTIEIQKFIDHEFVPRYQNPTLITAKDLHKALTLLNNKEYDQR